MGREYMWETSFAPMTRIATEARTEGVTKWITEQVDPRRRYKPEKLRSCARRFDINERPSRVGIIGHATIGSYLCDEIKKLPSNTCWWCGMDERQSQCEAWKPQITGVWKDNILEPRRSPQCLMTNESHARCCPSFATRRLGRW